MESSNLLIADMRSAINRTFKDAITSTELELTGEKGIDKTEDTYEELRARIKAECKEVFEKIEALDNASPSEIKDIAQDLREKGKQIGETFGDYLYTFARLVYLYAK